MKYVVALYNNWTATIEMTEVIAHSKLEAMQTVLMRQPGWLLEDFVFLCTEESFKEAALSVGQCIEVLEIST